MSEATSGSNSGTPEASSSVEGTSANTEATANELVVSTQSARAQEGDSLAAAAEQDVSAATAGPMPGTDVLRLADLLQGEHDGNLDALLTFTSDGIDTTLHVIAGSSVQPTQDIVLHGVGDLTAGGARSSSAIIADLLMQGALGMDAGG